MSGFESLPPSGVEQAPCGALTRRARRAPRVAVAYDAPVTGPTVVILAAGQGTRMRSRRPRCCTTLCGRPMVGWPVAAARAAGAGRIVVVDGPDARARRALPRRRRASPCRRSRTGPADAVAAARAPRPATATGRRAQRRRAAHHRRRRSPTLVAAHDAERRRRRRWRRWSSTTRAGYGRVVRDADGDVERVVETKAAGDATPRELAIDEVNTGIYAFDARRCARRSPRVGTDNAQGEHYLPDVLAAAARGAATRSPRTSSTTRRSLLGVNDRVDLARVRAIAQRRIHERPHARGRHDRRPGSDGHRRRRRDRRRHGDRAVDGPARRDARSAAAAASARGRRSSTRRSATTSTVLHAYVDGLRDRSDGVSVGPFAYLRPGTVLRDGAKVGTFVEIKNSDIGEGTKVPHLSYIGDADVGAGHEPRRRHDHRQLRRRATSTARRSATGVRTSVDTTFVAPVTVGDGAWTARRARSSPRTSRRARSASRARARRTSRATTSGAARSADARRGRDRLAPTLAGADMTEPQTAGHQPRRSATTSA